MGCGVVAWIVPLGTGVRSDQGALVSWAACLICKGIWLDGDIQQIVALRWSMFSILIVSGFNCPCHTSGCERGLFYQLLFIGFPGHPPDQPDHRTHDLWYWPRARWSGAADGLTTDVSRPREHAGYSKCECAGYFSPFIQWAAHKMKDSGFWFPLFLWLSEWRHGSLSHTESSLKKKKKQPKNHQVPSALKQLSSPQRVHHSVTLKR